MFASFTDRQGRISSCGALLVAASLVAPSASAAQSVRASAHQPATLVRVTELPEGSGLAASRRTPGRFWSHNDSGDPVLFALDNDGRVVGRVRMSGAAVEDWEAIAVGACPSGSCIYVADIGDNDAERNQITVYRIPEPSDTSGSVTRIRRLSRDLPGRRARR